jgi:hypothetical protein
MHAVVKEALAITPATDIAGRVKMRDWEQVSQDLDAQGCAMIKGLITPEECDALAGLYPVDGIFRSRVVMGRHGFGRGEYKYFSYPLPDIIAGLRTSIYPHLVPIANRWNTAMGIDARYPAQHAEQRPRMQSRPDVVPLRQGDAVVFAVHHRPVQGTRGVYRVTLRHGVSRLRSGHRHTVGVIFHDAT